MSRFTNPRIPFALASGLPNELGTVYYGEPNQDAISNPKVPYLDEALTTPASATQTLTAGGKLQQQLYLSGSYSIISNDKNGDLIEETLNYSPPDPETDVLNIALATFDNITDMVSGTTTGGQTITHALGQVYETLGYTTVNDGGAGRYVVTNDTANGYNLIDLGGSLTATLQTPAVAYNGMQFGMVSGYDTTAAAPDNYNELTQAIATALADEMPLFIPAGDYMVSDTIVIPHDFIFYGAGAKVTTFYPRIDFPFGAATEPKYIMADRINPGEPRPDANFYTVRRDFGVRNPGDYGLTANPYNHCGCYWARPGGGSEYTNLYLSDGAGENTLLVAPITPAQGGSGGTPVAHVFTNIWLANNRGAGLGRALNGLELLNAVSVTFNNLIVDYQSNEIDYSVGDTDGYGMKISGSYGCVFNTLNAEGNAKPFYFTSSQGCVINGGAVYRVGLGSSPSTDPDFAFAIESSKAGMPTLINFTRGQGYLESDGGGIATIRGGASLNIAQRISGDFGSFSYFNDNRTTLNDAYTEDTEFAGEAVNFTSAYHYYMSQTANSDFRPLTGVVSRTQLTSGVASFVDVTLRGAGSVVIVVRREDGSTGYAHVKTGIAVIATDTGAWIETDELFTNATYDIITTITASAGNLRINYSAPTATSIMEVYFTGSTLTNVDLN
jgi:hypothetical protein